jgi:hypothetical protein
MRAVEYALSAVWLARPLPDAQGRVAMLFPPSLRMYAHCARDQPAGALVLVLVNLNGERPSRVHLSDMAAPETQTHVNDSRQLPMLGRRISTAPRLEFELWSDSLLSQHVYLGRKAARPLQWDSPLRPRYVTEEEPLLVRPHSVLFAVLPMAGAAECIRV